MRFQLIFSLAILSQALLLNYEFADAFTLPPRQLARINMGTVVNQNSNSLQMSSQPSTFTPPLSDPADLDDFELSPEGLIQRAKVVLATDLGLQNGNLLADNFMWVGPNFEQPLNKKDYLAAGKFFDLRSTFPDLDYRGHDYRIDIVDPFTVRVTARTTGTMRGELRLRDKILPPNGKKMSCPPEAISITFDPTSGKISKLCTGFALDRLVGNSKGTCGVMAAATVAGEPPSDFEMYPIPTVISRFFGRPVSPLGESTTFLAPFPETVMVQLTKGILSSNMGADDASLLSSDFTYWTPTKGPIGKKKFLEEYAEEEFKGVEPEFSHFRVDPYDPYRVWVDVRPLAPGYEGCPQAMSFTFDDDGFCTRVTSSAVMDPTLGNGGGLGGPEGYKYAMGDASLGIATRPLPRVLGRLQKNLISPITGVGVDEYTVGDSSGLLRQPPAGKAQTPVETISNLKEDRVATPSAPAPEPKRPSFSIPSKAEEPKRPSFSLPNIAPKPAPSKAKAETKRPSFSILKASEKPKPAPGKAKPTPKSRSSFSLPKVAPKQAAPAKAKVQPKRPSFSVPKASSKPAPKKPDPTQAKVPPKISVPKPSPKPAAKAAASNQAAAAAARQAELKRKQEEAAKLKKEQEEARKAAAEEKKKELEEKKRAQAETLAAKKADAERKRKEAEEKKQAAAKEAERKRKEAEEKKQAVAKEAERKRIEAQRQKAAASVAQKAQRGASISLFGLGSADDTKKETDTTAKRPTIPLFGGSPSEDRATQQRKAADTAAKAKPGSTIALFGLGGSDDAKQKRATKAADTAKKAASGSTINLFGLGGGDDDTKSKSKSAPVKKRPSGPVKKAEAAQSGATINLFGRGSGTSSEASTPAKPVAKKAPSKPAPSKQITAPRGVPALKGWKKNADSSITGFISGSPNFRDGEKVTTSPISQGVISAGNVVKTSSGSRYFLS